ncbi:MAG: DUF6089 family protein [Bacteroidota bacterium]
MRKFCLLPLLLIVALISLNPASAQAQKELEIGLQAGVAGYAGDLRVNEFGLYLEDLQVAGGAYLRYRPFNRLALRLNGIFGNIAANDSRPGSLELAQRTGQIPLNFETSFTEFSLQAEFDLFYIGDPNGRHLAPYIMGGAGIFTFNPQSTLDGTTYDLQSLRTEGQGIASGDYDPAPYELTEWTLLVGGGLRWRAGDRLVLGLELGGRRTSTDYLDDVSDTRVNYLDILENFGPIAAELSNPFITDINTDDLDYRRGGEFNDWYFTGVFTLGITIGNGTGGGGKGCYTF